MLLLGQYSVASHALDNASSSAMQAWLKYTQWRDSTAFYAVQQAPHQNKNFFVLLNVQGHNVAKISHRAAHWPCFVQYVPDRVVRSITWPLRQRKTSGNNFLYKIWQVHCINVVFAKQWVPLKSVVHNFLGQ